MKKISLLIIAITFAVQGFSQQTGDTVISNNPQNLKLKVFYFHITHRCNTCYSIETNIRKTLTDYFANKVGTGIIDLYVLNCELPENKKLVEKYDAYGATLALTTCRDGKDQSTEDLTGWAFKTINKPELFISELKSKIEELIAR